MKKGIVFALAIAVVFMFVSCGDKPNGDNDKIVKESLEQQLIGTSWYQTTTTETEMGSGTIHDDDDGDLYPVDKITLTIKSTVTYTFNVDNFNCTTDVFENKSGITKIPHAEMMDDGVSVTTWEDKEVTQSTKSSNFISGTWNIENDRLYMIENNATQGTSFAVSIINDELILENEYAGIFLRLKRK